MRVAEIGTKSTLGFELRKLLTTFLKMAFLFAPKAAKSDQNCHNLPLKGHLSARNVQEHAVFGAF
jgi:hypothetical protein